MTKNSIHPFEPFIPEEAETLIIGTIPPQRFCISYGVLNSNDVKFYYGSKDNYFWKIISDINNLDFSYNGSSEAIFERQNFLSEKKIAITDIIKSCIHSNGSSLDKDLKDITYRKIEEILENENSKIKTLIYTSNFVKKLMNNYFKTYHHSILNEKKKFNLKILNKCFDVIILYSPSPTALRRISKEIRFEQYKKIFQS